MRTFILASALLLFFSFNTTAQSSFSLEGGLNLSKVKFTNSDLFDPESRSGFFLGVRHEMALSEKLSFNSAFQYSQEGYRVNLFSNNAPSPIPLGEFNYRYQYFRLIPQVEFKPHPMIGVFAGPNLGFAFKEELKIGEESWFDLGGDDLIENVDVGATVGLRYHLKRLTLSASYYHGFGKTSNFQETDADGNNLGDSYERNRSFQIGVGYAFLAS